MSNLLNTINDIVKGDNKMNVKVELLKEYVADFINQNIQDFEIDADKIADSLATKIIKEISDVLKNETYDDTDIVEEIVTIFEKHGIDTGACHN